MSADRVVTRCDSDNTCDVLKIHRCTPAETRLNICLIYVLFIRALKH